MNKPKYKVTLPEPRSMDEVPDESFHYIYIDGFIGGFRPSPEFQANHSDTLHGKAIAWIPAKATVKEEIVPGWCEYQVSSRVFYVLWRYSDGSVSRGRRKGCHWIPGDYEFIKQLTFEPEAEADS